MYGDALDINDSKPTLCGSAIRVGAEKLNIKSRIATLGGIIKVTNSEGLFNLYGMTAGHVFLPHWQYSEVPASTGFLFGKSALTKFYAMVLTIEQEVT